MGPYCKYCDRRCFVPLPHYTPNHIVHAYIEIVGEIPIIATCEAGQFAEKQIVGYCYNDIKSFAPIPSPPPGPGPVKSPSGD